MIGYKNGRKVVDVVDRQMKEKNLTKVEDYLDSVNYPVENKIPEDIYSIN